MHMHVVMQNSNALEKKPCFFCTLIVSVHSDQCVYKNMHTKHTLPNAQHTHALIHAVISTLLQTVVLHRWLGTDDRTNNDTITWLHVCVRVCVYTSPLSVT